MNLSSHQENPSRSNRMPILPDSFYAQVRAQCGLATTLLHDERDSPPERLLQAIWQHQRLRRDELKTADGQPLRVLHPGFGNPESGPDFRGAVLQLGDESPRAGDVEVDIRASGWRSHGHDRNPAFKNVVLHVLWDEDRPVAGAPPSLALRSVLDAPVGELSLLLGAEPARVLPELLRGKCSTPLRELPAERVSELLREAAQVRLQSKAARFQARAKQAGWEQALWEGLFRALGYKHNAWPMQCLAEQRPRWFSQKCAPLQLQSRLFGLSGLLPADLSRTQTQSNADRYLRRIWDSWWRERDEFDGLMLPRLLWRLHGQRPANHPQRRLALAAHWLAAGNLALTLERWCAATLPDAAVSGALLTALHVERDEFWNWHWTFRSARLIKPQPLIGPARVTDLAMNVILPWLWIRAQEGNNDSLQQAVAHRYHTWPAAEDNALLRLARQRLLGGAPRRALRTASEQQGLIQIVRDFCDHSNAICDDCQFPNAVRQWRAC
jgi:hypothetical protein